MCATALEFGRQNLQMNDEEDQDKDDLRLQSELKQLIEEEFDQIDLEDTMNDEFALNNAENTEYPISARSVAQSAISRDDTTSIAVAGHISELEEAIRQFGDNISHSEEDVTQCEEFYETPSLMAVLPGICQNNSSSAFFDDQPPVFLNSAFYQPYPQSGYQYAYNNDISNERNGGQFYPIDSMPYGLPSDNTHAVSTSETQYNHTPLSSSQQYWNPLSSNSETPTVTTSYVLNGQFFDTFTSTEPILCKEMNHMQSHESQYPGETSPQSCPSTSPLITNPSYLVRNQHHYFQRPQSFQLDTRQQFAEMRMMNPEPDDNASPICLSPAKSPHIHQTYEDVFLPRGKTHESDSHRTYSVTSMTRAEATSNELKEEEEEESRQRLIFEARGRQLIEAQNQIDSLKEEISQAEQVAKHKEIMSKAEIESLTRELERTEALKSKMEQRVAELTEAKSKMESELAEFMLKKTEFQKKLSELEATNASLSAELVQLTSGASVHLAKQRESNLAEGMARRYAMSEDVARENLEIAQRRLIDKEIEITNMRKELEADRQRSQQAHSQFNESISDLQNALKSTQDRCHELSSSSLCSEVTDLRSRIQEALTTKQITEDINGILQEELRDVREQIAMYEQSLGLNDFDMVIPPSTACSQDVDDYLKTPRPGLGGIFREEDDACFTSTIISRPHRRRRSCQSVTFAPSPILQTKDGMEEQPPRPASASAPLCSTRYSEEEDRRVRSVTPSRRSALGEAVGISQHTPLFQHENNQAYIESNQIEKVSISGLQKELKRALACYRAKRQQITSLHENLFTTRCELRKASIARDKAEAARSDLQLRVCSLEKELNLQGDIRKPGAREIALSGQVERLHADYARLETELQTARTRLQDALANESRALASERATRERLEASSAEKEAAMERTRATCEAHYTAARRRLEAEWSAEHDRLVQQARQEVIIIREEISTYQAQTERMTKLYHEARETTAKAVELTLSEAMREREFERIRFWREELPRQIEMARLNWLASQHAAVIEVEKKRKAELAVSRQLHQNEMECLQAELRQLKLASVKHLHLCVDKSVECKLESVEVNNAESANTSINLNLPLLNKLLTPQLMHSLIPSPAFISILQQIEASLDSLLPVLVRGLVDRVWHSVSQSIHCLLSEHKLLNKLSYQVSPNPSAPDVAEIIALLPAGIVETGGETFHQKEVAIIRDLAAAAASFYASATNGNTLMDASFEKIKKEVLVYVESCQSRSARVIYSSLARNHRRACRQMSKYLRAALVDAGAIPPELLSTKKQISLILSPTPRKSISLSESNLEALLHIIDSVCLATESSFSEDSRKGTPIFSPPNPSLSVNFCQQRKSQSKTSNSCLLTPAIDVISSVLGRTNSMPVTQQTASGGSNSCLSDKCTNSSRSRSRGTVVRFAELNTTRPIPTPRSRSSLQHHPSITPTTPFNPELKRLFDQHSSLYGTSAVSS